MKGKVMTMDTLIRTVLIVIGVMIAAVIMITAVPNAKEQALQNAFK